MNSEKPSQCKSFRGAESPKMSRNFNKGGSAPLSPLEITPGAMLHVISFCVCLLCKYLNEQARKDRSNYSYLSHALCSLAQGLATFINERAKIKLS